MRRIRPTQVVLGLCLLVVGAIGVVVAARQAANSDALLVLLVTAVGMAAILAAPAVHPALPITVGLMLTVFNGQWGHLGLPVPLDRAILAYSVFAAALRLLPDAADRWTLRVGRLHVLFAVVAVVGIASAVDAGTFGSTEPTFALTERLGIVGFLLFTVAGRAFASERSRDWLLIGLLVLGAYLALTGLLEGLGLDRLVFPSYITDPSVGINFGRARGPFVESGSFGLALFVCLVASVIAGLRWRHPWVRAVCWAIGAGCVLSIVFTLTRQAWLGAVLGAGTAMVMTPGLRRFILPAAVAGTAMVVIALTVVPGLANKVGDRGGNKLSVYDRLNSDKAAAVMALDHPLFGTGWYTFKDRSLSYLEQADNYPLRSVEVPHNVFLGFFAELGIVGGGLWLLAIAIAVGSAILGRAPNALEPWRVGLLAIAVDWVVVANLAPIGGAFINYVLWILPGVVWAGLPDRPVEERIRSARASRLRPRAPLPPGLRLGVILLAVAISGAAGYVVGRESTPTYRARADLTVGPPYAQALNYGYAFVGYERLASTYGYLGRAAQVIDPAARRLGMAPAALHAQVTVTPLLNAPVVSVRVKGPTAAAARERTRIVAEALRRSVARFNGQERTLRRLLAAYRGANREETRARGRVEAQVRALTATGRSLRSVLTGVGSVARAQVAARTALIRRVGIGSRYTSIAGKDRSLMDLQAPRAPFIDRGGREVDAQRFCVLFMVLGLIAGTVLGFFPPRRRRRTRPAKMAARAA